MLLLKYCAVGPGYFCSSRTAKEESKKRGLEQTEAMCILGICATVVAICVLKSYRYHQPVQNPCGFQALICHLTNEQKFQYRFGPLQNNSNVKSLGQCSALLALLQEMRESALP